MRSSSASARRSKPPRGRGIATRRSRSRHRRSAGLAGKLALSSAGDISHCGRTAADADSAAPATIDKDYDFVAKRFGLSRARRLGRSRRWSGGVRAGSARPTPCAGGEKSSKPAKTAAAAPLPAAEAVARASAWLDAARVMSANFVQIGPNGQRSEGTLSIARPGRMLFQYTNPARFEIVADGRSVAVIDHKLNTQDEYFIAQTPLKFLLSDHIDMARDTKVLSVAQEGNTVAIEIEDKAALGGDAHISLVFDASIRVEAMDGDRRARLPDGRHPVRSRPDDKAGSGAVPHRRELEPTGQPQEMTSGGFWGKRGRLLRSRPRRGMWRYGRSSERRMTISIATWNISSVRLRIDLVTR